MTDVALEGDELLVLARFDAQKGAMGDALIKLKTAASFPPSARPPEVLLELARLYAQFGLRERADPLFRKYLEERPGDVDALFQLGMVQFEKGLRAEAGEIWTRVLERVPGHPPAMYFQGVMLLDQGQPDAAMAKLKSLVAIAPHDNLFSDRARELIGKIAAGGAKREGEALIIPSGTDVYTTSH